MVQAREQGRFGEKARAHFAVLVLCAGEELERGMRAEACVFDLEDLRHAAFPERSDEFPVRDLPFNGVVLGM